MLNIINNDKFDIIKYIKFYYLSKYEYYKTIISIIPSNIFLIITNIYKQCFNNFKFIKSIFYKRNL